MKILIDPISESLNKLVNYFKTNGIPYVIVGGAAVIVTGRTRTTLDIDIILNHKLIDRKDFIKYLQENGFDATIEDLDGFDLEEICTFFLEEGMFKVDLKGKYKETDKQSIQMAIDSYYGDLEIKVANPINTILHKLKMGSEQDYEDALAVYVRNSETIDMNLLRKIANQMNIKNKLKDFLNEIERILKEEKWEL